MDNEKVVELAGGRARVVDAGGGDPVVVLHGWGGRIESMAPVVSCLAPHRRVVAIDLPGFGASPMPESVWGTPEYAGFVRALLDELDVGRASFVGHSFGAKVSFYLATIDPDRVDKLILVGATGLRMPPSMKARAKRGLSRSARLVGRLGTPGRRVRDLVYRSIASQDYRDAGEMRSIMVRVVNENLAALLPEVKAPTLLVWGSADDATPVALGKRMEGLIPDAGLVVFEGAGHFAYLDQPERFCTVARHFLGVAT